MTTELERCECLACGRTKKRASCVRMELLRPNLVEHLTKRFAKRFVGEGFICHVCLETERVAHVAFELERERGELSELEAEVAQRAANHSALSSHIEKMFAHSITPGQHLADRVASVGGSWPFVIGFVVVLVLWIAVNSIVLGGGFDPYPYILLNLMLSCLAAIQAPIIMMAQNRSSARDRVQADEDFKVNLKSELEIGLLHAKVDHLLHVQWERMVVLQQAQFEMLEDLLARRSRNSEVGSGEDG